MSVVRCVRLRYLKIPDNEADTALVTLRRLGLEIGASRAPILVLDDVGGVEALSRLRTVETIFNPNKHRLSCSNAEPQAGEIWIEWLGPQPTASGGRACGDQASSASPLGGCSTRRRAGIAPWSMRRTNCFL